MIFIIDIHFTIESLKKIVNGQRGTQEVVLRLIILQNYISILGFYAEPKNHDLIIL